MELVPGIKLAVQNILTDQYNYPIDIQEVLVNETKPEFTGDYTVVLFSFSRTLKISPGELGRRIGDGLLNSRPGWFAGYNIIKGFLNLVLDDRILLDLLSDQYN